MKRLSTHRQIYHPPCSPFLRSLIGAIKKSKLLQNPKIKLSSIQSWEYMEVETIVYFSIRKLEDQITDNLFLTDTGYLNATYIDL